MLKRDLQNLDAFNTYDYLNAVDLSGVRPPEVKRAMIDLRECVMSNLIDGNTEDTRRAVERAQAKLSNCVRRYSITTTNCSQYQQLVNALFFADLVPLDYESRLRSWERHFGRKGDDGPLLY